MGGSLPSGTASQTAAKKAKSNTPTLDQYGRDLTLLAAQNLIDPVIGRQTEIERVMQILSRRTKNNPCLIGEPGVGKTAVAEGLALQIARGEAAEMLAEYVKETGGDGRKIRFGQDQRGEVHFTGLGARALYLIRGEENPAL